MTKLNQLIHDEFVRYSTSDDALYKLHDAVIALVNTHCQNEDLMQAERDREFDL